MLNLENILSKLKFEAAKFGLVLKLFEDHESHLHNPCRNLFLKAKMAELDPNTFFSAGRHILEEPVDQTNTIYSLGLLALNSSKHYDSIVNKFSNSTDLYIQAGLGASLDFVAYSKPEQFLFRNELPLNPKFTRTTYNIASSVGCLAPYFPEEAFKLIEKRKDHKWAWARKGSVRAALGFAIVGDYERFETLTNMFSQDESKYVQKELKDVKEAAKRLKRNYIPKNKIEHAIYAVTLRTLDIEQLQKPLIAPEIDALKNFSESSTSIPDHHAFKDIERLCQAYLQSPLSRTLTEDKMVSILKHCYMQLDKDSIKRLTTMVADIENENPNKIKDLIDMSKLDIQDIQLQSKISDGHTARIFRGKYCLKEGLPPIDVVVKVMYNHPVIPTFNMNQLFEDGFEEVFRKNDVNYKLLNGYVGLTNLVEQYGTHISKDGKHAYIVYKCKDEVLSERMQKEDGNFMREYITKLVKSIEKMHDKNVAHGNIKADNLYVEIDTNEPIIGDYDTVRYIPEVSRNRQVSPEFENVGNPAHLSPEGCRDYLESQKAIVETDEIPAGLQRVDWLSNDIYAMGCMLFEAYTKRMPGMKEGENLKRYMQRKNEIIQERGINGFFEIIRADLIRSRETLGETYSCISHMLSPQKERYDARQTSKILRWIKVEDMIQSYTKE